MIPYIIICSIPHTRRRRNPDIFRFTPNKTVNSTDTTSEI